jgi:hypothetical protein
MTMTGREVASHQNPTDREVPKASVATTASSALFSPVAAAAKAAAEAATSPFASARFVPPTALARVQKSWELVEPKKLAIGLDFFRLVFTNHPHLLGLFPFGHLKEWNELRESAFLKLHAVRVMTAVGHVVADVSDVASQAPALRLLGKRHVQYGVIPEMYDT